MHMVRIDLSYRARAGRSHTTASCSTIFTFTLAALSGHFTAGDRSIGYTLAAVISGSALCYHSAAAYAYTVINTDAKSTRISTRIFGVSAGGFHRSASDLSFEHTSRCIFATDPAASFRKTT